MLKVKEAVIVEGKYDKIKLSNLLDALIIETNGFSVYKDKKKLAFIKKLANERGLIVITDSDHSGFQIRNYLSSVIPKDKIKHIYIPDIYGKEKRKKEPSKEGKIGVEGINDDILLELFKKANISSQPIVIPSELGLEGVILLFVAAIGLTFFWLSLSFGNIGREI